MSFEPMPGWFARLDSLDDDPAAPAALRDDIKHALRYVTNLRVRLTVAETRRTGAEADLAFLNKALRPLCPCNLNPETTDGPCQECPLHGDGETFVAEVQDMRAQLDQQAQIMREQGAQLREANNLAYEAWCAGREHGR